MRAESSGIAVATGFEKKPVSLGRRLQQQSNPEYEVSATRSSQLRCKAHQWGKASLKTKNRQWVNRLKMKYKTV
jgi:hypothetical protein